MKTPSWKSVAARVAKTGGVYTSTLYYRHPVQDGVRALVSVNFVRREILDQVQFSVVLHSPNCYHASECPEGIKVARTAFGLSFTVIRIGNAWVIEDSQKCQSVFEAVLADLVPSKPTGVKVAYTNMRARESRSLIGSRARVYTLDTYET